MSEGMTLRQYGKARGISAQAASQLFKRHKVYMDDMYEEGKNSIILNERGIEYLDVAREKKPKAINHDTIADLRGIIQVLRDQVASDQEEIRHLREQLTEKDKIITEKEKTITDKEKIISVKEQQLKQRDDQIMLLGTRKPKRGIFGLFRRNYWETSGENQTDQNMQN